MKKLINLFLMSVMIMSGTSCRSEAGCTGSDFLALAADRYSVRKFDSTVVDPAIVEKILKAGQLAPTAVNAQPQKIYVVESEEMMQKMNEVSPCIYGAPHCFVVCYDRNVAAHRGENGTYGEIDATIVITHMMLEAADLGIGTCLVGYFNQQSLSAALELPENIVPVLVMPFGYAAKDCEPSPKHTDRKTLEEIVEYR